MKEWLKDIAVLAALLSLLALGWVYVSHAAAEQDAGVAPAQATIAALGLTDQQKEQLKDISAKYKPTLRPVIRQYRAESRQLRKLIHATVLDDGAIRAQAATVASFGADLAVQRAHLIQDVRSVLTPDQISKLGQTDGDAVNAGIDRLLLRLARRGMKD
ncbi:MAG: Spy/CpxP family protein refolding chaperone [Nitrospirae bacterium]|nr:Spy/CpxP family protein refolding chaperone [Nitrospirota bacterium]